VAASVAVAFADSSIVVLALPDLYGAFDTTIVGVSWVITSYNLVVAVVALLLVPAARRLDARRLAQTGLALFTIASVGCAASWSLVALIAFRCLQGFGAALLLAASLALLAGLLGSREQGAALWTTVATLGAALGPALGGALTQLFEWRAIFVAQAPVAAAALLATRSAVPLPGGRRRFRRRGALAADASLAFVFGGLVGALFLSVLLVITVWGLDPIVGALIVTALPAAALATRPLARGLTARVAVSSGALLLAGGLGSLALLPRVSNTMVAVSLAFCGAGIGLAVPILTRASLDQDAGIVRSGALTIAARHAGLVLALALVGPLLTAALDSGGQRALLGGTRVILDGDVTLSKKVPIALDLRDALDSSPKGEVPDLAKPFDERGAKTDSRLRHLRDSLVETLKAAITRGFRSSFGLAALLALLALVPVLRLRRV
jgi:MFS family permease